MQACLSLGGLQSQVVSYHWQTRLVLSDSTELTDVFPYIDT